MKKMSKNDNLCSNIYMIIYIIIKIILTYEIITEEIYLTLLTIVDISLI